MNDPKQTPRTKAKPSTAVVIDAGFVRDVAKQAVVQFFVPLTAAFARSTPDQRRRRAG
ncbi:hypothetical protein [Brevundimonas sp. FT23042]|uniref:hypothetical protein n=1 Tax=Brevundimonas sp. FT23042 TaxID=3393749 RepID=UPI003B585E1F